jgi:hypothetical protein
LKRQTAKDIADLDLNLAFLRGVVGGALDEDYTHPAGEANALLACSVRLSLAQVEASRAMLVQLDRIANAIGGAK